LSSSSEIVRRTNVLFKNVDKLEELTLVFLGKPKERTAKAGNVLRCLKESKIRKTCGEVIYRAGVAGYTLISEEKFADNTLLGRVRGKNHGDIQYFQPSISLERSAGTIRTFGECQCALAREGTICPHMAALLIAWVRAPQKFEEDLEFLRTRFEKARQDVTSSLEELLVSMETSSRAEVFDLLQKTFSQIRRWGDRARELEREPIARFDSLREFSAVINCISLAIMAAVERKYSVRAMDIYNRATLTTLGRVLELFAESTNSTSPGKKVPHKATASSEKTSRSWDVLVENFAKSSD